MQSEIEFLQEQYKKISKDYSADWFTTMLFASIIDRINLIDGTFPEKENSQKIRSWAEVMARGGKK